MRVLFLALNWNRAGGLEIYNANLVDALQAAGCQVEVWSVFDQAAVSTSDEVVHPLAPSTPPALHLYGRCLWKRLVCWKVQKALDRFDLIIAGHVYVLPSLYQALRSRPALSVPYWVWTYGIEIWGSWSPLVEQGMAGAQRIVSISRFTASKVRERLKDASVVVLHNPVDVERFRPADKVVQQSPAPRLLTVGRLSSQERYKGHEVVMQSLPLLNQRLDKSVEYWIVGDGDDLQRLREFATQLGLQQSVRFLGRIPDDQLVRTYQECDVFVMPSKVERRPDGTWAGEGFGVVYIEAAACAKPVIASNQGGAREAVLDGVTSFTVDPTSPEAVADAAYRLLSDPDLARQMGAAGRQFVVKNFSLPVFCRRVNDLLKEAGFTSRG